MKSQISYKIIRTAAVLFCTAGLALGSAMAQQDTPPAPDSQTQGPPPGGSHGPDSGRRLEMMQKHLNLTPDQTTQVKAILDDEHSKMEAMHSNTSLAPQDRHAQMMTIHQDGEAKIRAVLNPDQQTKFDQMQARQREHMHNRGQGATPSDANGGDNSAPPAAPPQ